MPTPDFMFMASVALDEVINESGREGQTFPYVNYVVRDNPESWDYTNTGADPDSVLMAMYEPLPAPKVTLFADSLLKLGHRMGSIPSAIKTALWHELWQHHLGYDHTKETYEAGLAPGMIMNMQAPASAMCQTCCGECGL